VSIKAAFVVPFCRTPGKSDFNNFTVSSALAASKPKIRNFHADAAVHGGLMGANSGASHGGRCHFVDFRFSPVHDRGKKLMGEVRMRTAMPGSLAK
jgi:hypothetical protein